MPSEPKAPIRGRQLEALRACLLYPQGLRRGAYPSAMAVLRRLGLVESRSAPGPGRRVDAWFITPAGREHLTEIDASKPGARRAVVQE
ncbi:hypothetical protein [Methylobacterium sp. D54C]